MLKRTILFGFLVIFSIICFLPTVAIGQTKKTIFKVNLLSPFFRSIAFSAEKLMAEKTSFQLSVFYTDYNSKTVDFQGFGITPELRFYLDASESPAGFFVNTFLRYQDLNLLSMEESQKASLYTFGVGAGLGGQWIFDIKPTFTLEIFAGAVRDFFHLDLEGGAQIDSFMFDEFIRLNPRFGITTGIAF